MAEYEGPQIGFHPAPSACKMLRLPATFSPPLTSAPAGCYYTI